mmetsp:Transcript_15911/g.41105  ORF Transcript_15911/g.41105 Transcript_15911/m.41105 type:complete len:222 (+) Transcript_15911:343-1008(+)
MSHAGGFIFCATSPRASRSFVEADSIRGVCNAPQLISFACNAPPSLTDFSSFCIESTVPAHVAPLGNSSFVRQHTAFGPSLSLISLHMASSFLQRIPATVSVACAGCFEASATASPCTLTMRRASSKLSTPAATSAAYSPTSRPATAPGRDALSGLVCFSCSRAANPAMKSTGWLISGWLSFDNGPFKHTSKGSQPRSPFATSSICLTPGSSLTPPSMPTY